MKIILFYVRPCSPQLRRLIFLLKTQKTTALQPVTGGNTPNIVLKRMLIFFSRNSTTQENITRISKSKKKDLKFVQKVNFKPKIKPVIENLQNELDQ